MIEILQAIFLGVVEGLTEFLPISSTGHLYLSQRLIGYKDSAEIFTVVIQVGAIAAVIWFYRNQLLKTLSGIFKKNKAELKFTKNWILATIPAGIAGIFLEKHLDSFNSNLIIALSLLVGGIVILLVEKYYQSRTSKTYPQFEKLTFKQSIQIGLYQVIAIIPGVSRSGATILGGMLSGLDRVTATAFSFYLSIPIIVLASGFKLFKDGNQLSTVSGGAPALIAGTVASFISAFIVVGWLLRFVSKNNFKIFAYYRIVLGILILFVLAI